jgi:hypothetical protein
VNVCWATPNRETNGGMRRCQRLPDVTHPVDSTRPADQHIKSHARGLSNELVRTVIFVVPFVLKVGRVADL